MEEKRTHGQLAYKELAYTLGDFPETNPICKQLENIAKEFGKMNGVKLVYESHLVPNKPGFISCSLTAKIDTSTPNS